ncbi:MAG: hypothetical protein KAJ14_02195 [Candidatus Omnitrophica bacterium]|nr:hypothetical protein [Candidatus Omnitrophota bacterium]
MNKRIYSIIVFLVLISFMSSYVCLADISRSTLAPNLGIQNNNVQDFLGRSKDVESFIPTEGNM